MKMFVVLALMAFSSTVSSFGGSEDRFIKKYAMMKIYESCFGEDVVKQIRREMKLACAKCAAPDILAPTPPPTTQAPPEDKPQQEDGLGPNSVYHNQPTFDAEKLHQAILAFRPNPMQQPSYRPFPGVSPSSFYNPPSFANPGYSAVPPMFYPGYQQVPYSPYGFPILGQQYFGNRMSREMDIKNQLEALTTKMSGKLRNIRNVTCVMQELGYLDDNLEPNYAKISERIGNLPVTEELRRDMQDGVTFCEQFSQCVPEAKVSKSPLSRELIRPMFFFKCYKHKKLEACIMKDVREKYSGVADEDLDEEMEIRRTGKAAQLPNNNERDIDDFAASVYEFLYASDGNDFDSLF